jgi:hypothetical protein
MVESPGDVTLHHAVFTEMLRVGELPERAWINYESLQGGRPIQPWQWIPASYVLLEAEEVGRHTEWRAGKVEIEWAGTGAFFPSIPAWGLDAERLLDPIDREAGWTWRHRRAIGDRRRYDALGVGTSKLFVSARPVDYTQSAIVAGINPDDVVRQDGMEALDFFPARFVPGLAERSALRAKLALATASSGYMHIRVPEPGVEPGGHFDVVGHPAPYTGSFPDVFDPQMLLQGFARIKTLGSGENRRRVPGEGPLLDVRLIKRVRIMERVKGRWS